MYKTFYGLKRDPFSVAADPRFIYMSPDHRQAAHHLLFGLQSGAGFILLTGEIGSGKSMVCRAFLRMLPPNVDVANVVNPHVTFGGLLMRICEELKVEVASSTTDLIDAIHGHLLLSRAQGRRTLIIVDEAQALSHEVLELLRLLTNLDSTGRHLQIFLIGQPELRETLRLPALEPVSQRIVARFHLKPLPELETPQYITHRLRVAGLEGPVPFDDEAIRAVHRWSGGIPRRINVLCDRAMLTAREAGVRDIGSELIDRIAPEVFDEQTPVAPALSLTSVGARPARASAASEVPAAPSSVATQRRRWPSMAAMASLMIVLGTVLGVLLLDVIRHSRGVAALPVAATPSAAVGTPTSPVRAPGAQADMGDSGPAAALARSAAPPATVPFGSAGPRTPDHPSPQGVSGAPRAHSQIATTTLEAAAADEAESMRDLAQLWGVSLPGARACLVAGEFALRCYRMTGGLDKIRLLDRPGVLSVSRANGSTGFVLLVGITQHAVLLHRGARELTLPLEELAGRWRGDFVTLLRAPAQPPTGTPEAGSAAMTEWLRQRLTGMDGGSASDAAAPLTARLVAFQMANGLQPDGVAGPLTLMKLNRASGLVEPPLAVAH
jgi:general secretion pathway protein A